MPVANSLSPRGLEVCWVIEGAVRIELPNEVHDLRSRDALQFEAVLARQYTALRTVRMLIRHLAKGKRF
jgi:hypothetical protein